MSFVEILCLITISVVFMPPILGQGRRPQPIEHNYCSLMFAEQLEHAKTIDRLATVVAYNIGRNGSLCMTTCRILSRGNVQPFDPLPTPDFVRCTFGAQYCYKGNCTNEKELGQLLKKNP